MTKDLAERVICVLGLFFALGQGSAARVGDTVIGQKSNTTISPLTSGYDLS